MHSLHNLFPASGTLPLDWAATLYAIGLETRSTPVLSGGAIRDHFHGKPVKDLDIFVPWDMDAYEALNTFMDKCGWSRIQNIPPSCEGLGEVVAVVGYSKLGEIDLNVIFLDTSFDLSPLGIASRNDFGICQIAAWVEMGQWFFEYTGAFCEDVFDATFTLTRTGDEARSLRRYERLIEKYPDHMLVTPHINLAEFLQV